MANDQNESPNQRQDATKPELHKPPVLLFFLPLVLIIVYAFFSR
jgi:hypothetical protein